MLQTFFIAFESVFVLLLQFLNFLVLNFYVSFCFLLAEKLLSALCFQFMLYWLSDLILLFLKGKNSCFFPGQDALSFKLSELNSATFL